MGLNPDEALVFLVEEVDGENSYSLITDDDLLAEIEEVYNNMEQNQLFKILAGPIMSCFNFYSKMLK